MFNRKLKKQNKELEKRLSEKETQLEVVYALLQTQSTNTRKPAHIRTARQQRMKVDFKVGQVN